MRILHFTAMSPLSPNSGLPVVLKNLTDEQNKIEGVEARVLALCSSVDMIDSQYFDSLGKDSLNNYITKYAPDIAIIHSFYHIEYSEVARILFKKRIPYLIEPHGSFGHKAIKKGRLKKWIADHTVFRKLIGNASGFVFTNVAEANDTAYIPKESVLIPNGVVQSVAENSSAKTESSINDPVFYFLGRYDINHKGLDYLLDALEILDEKKYDFSVCLYGVGSDTQNRFVREKISHFKHLNVRDMGPIYSDKKKEALEKANILILTSRYEGSPMTILDGFCYGNPCLVTPGTNMADEVSQHHLGWKTELDAKSIASNILKIREIYRADAMGYYTRCKKYVLSQYTWPKLAALSIEKYKHIIEHYTLS